MLAFTQDILWCWGYIIKQIFHADFRLVLKLFTLGKIIFKTPLRVVQYYLPSMNNFLKISQYSPPVLLALAGFLLQNTYGGCFWIFAAANTFFSTESDICCWQSHQVLLRTPLKTRVKLQKQPLELFGKKCVLGDFANFTGKPLCWSLLLTELQVFRPAALLKKETPTQVFYCGIYKF